MTMKRFGELKVDDLFLAWPHMCVKTGDNLYQKRSSDEEVNYTIDPNTMVEYKGFVAKINLKKRKIKSSK